MKLAAFVLILALTSVRASAGGLEVVPLACSGSNDARRTGGILIVDGALAGIRLDTAPAAATYVIYDEDEQGMALVNPLEYSMERQDDLSKYSAVLQLSANDVANARARKNFVAALLSGQPVGSTVEALTCVVRP